MSRPSRAEQEAAKAAHEVAARAIRRLDILEWVILFGAAVLAVAGGLAVAWLIGDASGFGFRPTWVVASLLLFVIPGAIAIRNMRKDAESRHHGTRTSNQANG